MLTTHTILAALIGYLALLLLVARLAARKSSNALFFTAERGVAWYVAWPAMITAAMSGITFVSLPGSVATDGFTYL
ncbi:MAG: sodium:solute symporter, partial [Alistipes sp.]|nr:sodium:solute symporter [Alistipes sp.]